MSSTSLPQDVAASTRLYRAIWRWHFYAGPMSFPSLYPKANRVPLAILGLAVLVAIAFPWAVPPSRSLRLSTSLCRRA